MNLYALRQCWRLQPALAATALAVLLALGACSSDTPQSLLASGQQFAAKGDHAAAAIQFKGALQLDPKFTAARVELGRSLLASSDPKGAALELTRALNENASAEEVVPTLARALVLAGDYKTLTSNYGDLVLQDKAAVAELKTQVATAWGALGDRARTQAATTAALAAVPDFGPALILRARLLAGESKFTEAIALLDEVVKQPSKLHDAWHLKGEIQDLVNGDPAAAATSFQEALKIEPAYVPAHAALIGQRVRQGDLPGAKAQADKLRAVLPNHPMTALMDAQLAFLDRNLPLAKERGQALLRVFPNNMAVLLVNGAVESETGNLLQAEAHFGKAIQLNPSSWVARRNLGEVYVRLGQPAKALETLQPLLNSNPPRVEALSLAGDAALRLGDAAAAERFFIAAARVAPDNNRIQTAVALSQLTRGEASKAFSDLELLAKRTSDTYADEAIFSARMKRREFEAALRALDDMQRKAPDKRELEELRGRVHLAKRDWPAARQAFEAALKRDSASFAAVSGLVQVDIAEKKIDQALKRLQDNLAANPRNHYAHVGIAEIKIFTGAPLEEVRQPLTSAIQLAPNDSQPRLLLIEHLLRKRQFKDALVVAQDAAAALPNDPRVLDAVGRAQLESGDVEQAISTYRRLAANESNSAAAYARLAEIFQASGRRPQAEAALRKALELEPGLRVAQASLMGLLIDSGRRSEALAFARKLQTDQPTQAAGYLMEGAFHTRVQAPDAAIAAYRNGLAKTGQSEVAITLYRALMTAGKQAEAEQFGGSWMKSNPKDLLFDYVMAEVAIMRSKYAEAEPRLRRVLAANPDNVLALNNLAWALTQLGKPGAAALAQRAVDAAPTNVSLLDTLATAQAAEGQPALAVATQQRALELAPDNHDLRLGLARFALQAGNKALASQQLQRLRDLGPAYKQQAEVTRLSQSL
jgi:cellulose synthase operon protein C